VARIATSELWTNKKTPEKNFFAGNGISQLVDSESPLSIGLQTALWPPKFKPVSLPKYNGFRNSRQFFMRYESAVNSAGGDDVALAKSFIIACKGPVLNWYSLLPPHSVCSWVDLKTKFMQAFQMFHDTTTESSDLYNCKQKDREPLRNFVRRFMQQRSQIPEADDKTMIKALIKGLIQGQQLRITRKRNPRQLKNSFTNLKNIFCLMMIIAKESSNEMKRDRATEKRPGDHNSKSTKRAQHGKSSASPEQQAKHKRWIRA
jgi:hypothetical protein